MSRRPRKYQDDDPRHWVSVCVNNCKYKRPVWQGVPEEMIPRVKAIRAERRRASYVPVPKATKQGVRQAAAHALYREFLRLSAQAGEQPDMTMTLLRRFHDEHMENTQNG